MAGEVQLYFHIEFSAQGLVKSGELKALGVTGRERSPQFPNVPTLNEQGVKDFELYAWFGIVVPADVPDAVVERLNDAANRAMETATFKEQLNRLGAIPMRGSPTQSRTFNFDPRASGPCVPVVSACSRRRQDPREGRIRAGSELRRIGAEARPDRSRRTSVREQDIHRRGLVGPHQGHPCGVRRPGLSGRPNVTGLPRLQRPIPCFDLVPRSAPQGRRPAACRQIRSPH